MHHRCGCLHSVDTDHLKMSFHFKLPSLRSADKAANDYEQFWQVGLGADHFTSQKVRFDSEKVGILSGGQVLLASLTRKWQQQIFSSNPNFVYYKSRLAPRRKREAFSAVSVWRKVIYLIRTCQNEGTLFTVAKKENAQLSQGKSQVTISRHFFPEEKRNGACNNNLSLKVWTPQLQTTQRYLSWHLEDQLEILLSHDILG